MANTYRRISRSDAEIIAASEGKLNTLIENIKSVHSLSIHGHDSAAGEVLVLSTGAKIGLRHSSSLKHRYCIYGYDSYGRDVEQYLPLLKKNTVEVDFSYYNNPSELAAR